MRIVRVSLGEILMLHIAVSKHENTAIGPRQASILVGLFFILFFWNVGCLDTFIVVGRMPILCHCLILVLSILMPLEIAFHCRDGSSYAVILNQSHVWEDGIFERLPWILHFYCGWPPLLCLINDMWPATKKVFPVQTLVPAQDIVLYWLCVNAISGL